MVNTPLTRDDVEVLHKHTPFKGYFQIDTYTVRHRTYAGDWIQPVTREVFERGHAVAVILYDPQRDCVGLIEQFRCGAFAADMDPWLIECVAGIIEPGETPDQVAWREVQEEAGIRPLDLIPIQKFIVTPGGSSETCWLYCARVDSTQLSGTHGLADEGEDIRVLTLPTDEAYALLRSGKIPSLMAAAALQWLVLERPALQKRWQETLLKQP